MEAGRLARAVAALASGLALALTAAPAAAEWVEWIGDFTFETEFNDNLNQTGFDADEASDFTFRHKLAAGRVYQLGDLTRLSGTLDVEGALHARFDRLDSITYGVTLAAFHKFGLGPTRPWARAHVSGARFDLKEHGRDSWLAEGGLKLGMRFTPRLDASLAYAYEWRDGDSGRLVAPGFATDVWDQARHRVTAEAAFLLTDLLLLSGGVEYLNGDFESSCPKAGPGGGGGGGGGPIGGGGPLGFLGQENPEAAALDEVFGNAPGDCVYRIDGDIYAAFVGLNYPVTDRIGVDLRYRFQYGNGNALHYQSQIATLAFSFRY